MPVEEIRGFTESPCLLTIFQQMIFSQYMVQHAQELDAITHIIYMHTGTT